MKYEEKKKKLIQRLQELTKEDTAIAFSGGVDSSLLLIQACKEAKKNGTVVYAVTMDTELHPKADEEIAKKVAGETDAVHTVIHMDELKDADIRKNPVDRCYRCKRFLFQNLLSYAREKGAAKVMEGSNLDDLGKYRPGLRAVKELGVYSPLAECEFTKNDVRKMAAEYGIRVANRPSTPCLATRFPYGTRLSIEEMRKVEQAEEILKAEGFYNVRFRVHGTLGRIEVDEKDMDQILSRKDIVVPKLKKLGYDYITVDLEGFRSGSMDIGLGPSGDGQ